jgi:hypothetical protein
MVRAQWNWCALRHPDILEVFVCFVGGFACPINTEIASGVHVLVAAPLGAWEYKIERKPSKFIL